MVYLKLMDYLFSFFFLICIFPALGMGQEQQVSKVFSPGDALKISIFPDTASFPNGVYFIDDQGYVDLPIVGMMKVTSMSSQEVEDELKKVYISFLARPNIHVRPLMRATLVGGFSRPGMYWIDPREGMWSLLQKGGGTIREDGLEKLQWYRNGQVISKNLITHFESGQSLKKIGFKSGDQIFVTKRPKRKGWDVFRSDILPLVTFTLTTISSTVTAYFAIRALK